MLIGALLAKNILFKPEIETTEYESLKIALKSQDVFAVELKRAQEMLRFEKGEDQLWRIPAQWNIRAQKDKIEGLIKNIADLEGELRSNSAELFSDFGIAEDEAFSLTFFNRQDKPFEVFYVGTKKAGWESSFLRKSESPLVYLVNKDILSLIGIYEDPEQAKFDAQQWIDLTVTSIDVDATQSIKVVRRENGNEIVRTEIEKQLDQERNLKHWVAIDREPPFVLDAKKIKEFLKEINDIRAQAVLDPEAKDYGFNQPFLTLTLADQDNAIELVLGNTTKDEGQDRYCRNSQGHVFELRRYNVDKLNIDTSRFFIDNPLRIDKDTLQSLEITADNEKITLNKELIEKNTDYLDKIKQFSVQKLLFAERYSAGLKIPTPYSLVIAGKTKEPIVLDVSKTEDNQYIAQLRGTQRHIEYQQRYI